MTVTDEQFRDFLDVVNKNVMESGVHLTYVFPEADADGAPKPGFCYTAGLTETGHSELIIFGLSQEMAGYALNEIYAKHIKNEALLVDEFLVEGMFGASGEFPVLLLDADPDKTVQHTSVARHRAMLAAIANGDEPTEETQRIRCLQVVFTDLEGNWPWEEDYALDARVQPCLIPGREEWTDGGDPREEPV